MNSTPRFPIRFRLTACVALLACAVFAASATRAGAQASTPANPASLDAILKAVSTFDGGIESAALWQLRDYVHARKDDPAGRAECETKLLQFLKTPATPVAKMAATRLLRLIAGDTAIPALQAMLVDPRFSDFAIYVLQLMPGAAAEHALVQGIGTASGGVKAAIVVALGQRRAASALPLLEPLLRDKALGSTAATAIGRIGGPNAAAALAAAYAGASGDPKRVLAASMIETADGLLIARQTADARGLFDMLAADRSLAAPMRRAALMGKISAAGAGAPELLLSMLGGDDADARAAAIARIAEVIPPDGIGPVCERLPRLPESSQVQVLAVLAGYPASRVRPAVLDAARSASADVRVSALRALESVGDASLVPFLAETAAASPRGPVQDAARRALGSLKGRAVDDAVLAALKGQPSDAVSGELLKAVTDRRIFLAKPAVTSALSAPSPAIRIEALKALRAIGSPSDASPVLGALLRSGDEIERGEAEKTVAVLLEKITNPDGRSRMIRIRLAAEKDPAARAKLIGILAPTSDGAALPVLRTALTDSDAGVVDAAVRALAAWPTATARDDVLKLAREAKDETHRLLAITGLVRIIGLDVFRLPEAAVADLRQASGLAWRPEEQKLVLSALASFPCKAALDMATGFLKDEALRAEAQAAIEKITPRLPKTDRR